MSDEAPVNGMAEPPRPVLLLFMGENEDHAITSFQRFFPASVHIVTSDNSMTQRTKSWPSISR